MDLEQIVVLAFCAVAIAPLVWIERRSRKQAASAQQQSGGNAQEK